MSPKERIESTLVNNIRTVKSLAGKTRTLIWLFGMLLGLLFTWIKLADVPLTLVFSDRSAQTLFRASLVLYYFSWLFGTNFDLGQMEDVLVKAPTEGELPRTGIALAAGLAMVFGVLCAVTTIRSFVLVLLGFWLFNILAWRYLVRGVVLQPIRDSCQTYLAQEDYPNLARLELVRDHIDGRWQWKRFAVGGVLILLTIVLVFSISALNFTTRILSSRLPGISEDFILAAAVFVSILAMELWIWYKRLRLKLAGSLIDELSESYEWTMRSVP